MENAVKDISVEERQATLLKGGELLMALKLTESKEYFERIKEDHPHYMAMYTMTVYTDTVQNRPGDKSAEESLYKLINKVLKVASNYCHLQINTVDVVFSSFNKAKPTAKEMQKFAGCQLIAFTLLMKASLQIRQQSYVKAGISFRKSYKFYEECHRILMENKEDVHEEYLHDVLFGVGLFNFVISLVPPAFTFFVEALGFKGDREKGFNLLKQCGERYTFTGLVSLLIVQLLYQFYFENSERALEIIDLIQDKFPNTTVALFASGYSLRFIGSLDKAETIFQKIFEAANQMTQLRLSCLYEIGTTAVKRSDWRKAIENINGYLVENPPEGYRCYAAYEVGVCYCFLKDFEKAQQNFKKSVTWVRKEYVYDVFAARKSKQFLDNYKQTKEFMSPFEMIYFRSREQFKVNQFEESFKTMKTAKELNLKTLSPDYRAMYFLLCGENLRKLQQYEKAQKKLERALQEKTKTETYVHPHALVELAHIAISLKKPDEAKKFLKQAKEDYKGYDFNSQLLRTITRLFDNLEGATF